jgi:DNA replication protein DnaC
MTNETTLSKLNDMRLSAMSETYREQLRNPEYQELSFEERFSLLVDIEWSRRQNNKLDRLIKNAQFRSSQASIEDIEYHPDRKLDKTQILRLASGQYIEEHHNIILKGASGNGKTYLACAFGIAACRQLYKVKYTRLPDLLDELAVARGEGIFRKVMKQYKTVNLLILDEWLLTPLKGNEARDLLEIIESKASHWINHFLFSI